MLLDKVAWPVGFLQLYSAFNYFYWGTLHSDGTRGKPWTHFSN